MGPVSPAFRQPDGGPGPQAAMATSVTFASPTSLPPCGSLVDVLASWGAATLGPHPRVSFSRPPRHSGPSGWAAAQHGHQEAVVAAAPSTGAPLAGGVGRSRGCPSAGSAAGPAGRAGQGLCGALGRQTHGPPAHPLHATAPGRSLLQGHCAKTHAVPTPGSHAGTVPGTSVLGWYF